MKIAITSTIKEDLIINALLKSGLYSNRTELFRACVREIMQEFRHNGYKDIIESGVE